jgi:hypothetical protein
VLRDTDDQMSVSHDFVFALDKINPHEVRFTYLSYSSMLSNGFVSTRFFKASGD